MPEYPIQVVDYDPQWPLTFAELSRLIGNTLGDLGMSIEHDLVVEEASLELHGRGLADLFSVDVTFDYQRGILVTR